MSELRSGDDRIDVFIAEYLKNVAAGSVPDRAALLVAHPDLAEELHSFFADHDRMQRFVEPPTIGPDEPRALPVGELVRYFGDYELLEELARGGMGVVYKARQLSLNRLVAIKMILAGQLASPADVQRFRAEAEAAANLDHPNIVPIYEVGEHQGQQYFSMKLIGGGSLARWLKNRNADSVANREKSYPKSSDQSSFSQFALSVLSSVARAVHFAHQRGILHRDLKPGNILLGDDGQPLVTDFGLAKRVEGDSKQTQTGAILGTPSYMAPEQARAEKTLTTAVDVYSLGAILYEILTGRPPFTAPTTIETVLQVLELEPVRPSLLNSRVDRDLETIALKCLEKDPAQRYESAAALADELDRWQRGEPIQAKPISATARVWKWAKRRPAVAGLVAVSSLAAMTLMVLIAVHNRTLNRTLDDVRKARDSAEQTNYGMRLALTERELLDHQLERAATLLDQAPSTLRHWEWHYLDRQVHAEKLRVTVPNLWPMGGVPLAAHPNEPYFATVTVPDPQKGEAFVEFRRFEDGARFRTIEIKGIASIFMGLTAYFGGNARMWLRFSADGQQLAVGGVGEIDDGKLKCRTRIFDVATGHEICTLRSPTGVPTEGTISPNGNYIATAPLWGYWPSSPLREEPVRLWDNTGQLRFSIENARAPVANAAKGRYLVAERFKAQMPNATTYHSDGLQLFDMDAGGQPDRIFGDSAENWAGCAVSPDGRLVAAVNQDHTRLWSLDSPLAAINKFPVKGTEVTFGQDGQWLAIGNDAAGSQRIITVIDIKTSKQRTISGGQGRPVFSNDGRYLAAFSHDQDIKVWDLAAAAAVPEVQRVGNGGGLNRIAYSGTGNKVAVGNGQFGQLVSLSSGNSYTFGLYDLTGRTHESPFWQTDAPILDPCFCRDGKALVAIVGSDMLKEPRFEIRGRDLVNNKDLFTHPRPGLPPVRSLAVSPDGSKYAIGLGDLGQDESLEICDFASGLVLNRIAIAARHTAWNPNGTQLAAADPYMKEVHIVDVTTGQVIRTLKLSQAPGTNDGGHLNYGHRVAWSRDGQWIAAVSDMGFKHPGSIAVWNAATGKLTFTLRGHSDVVNALAFSPDCQRLVSGSEDHTIKIWELVSGQPVLTLRGHNGPVLSVAFSPDGHRLLSTSSSQFLAWDGTPRN